MEQNRQSGWAATAVAPGATAVTLVTVLSALVVLVLIPTGNSVGIAERVSVSCISAWLVLLAWDLAVRRRAR